MKTLPQPSVRLYAIQARNAPVAVVFRRGPSSHVELIKWDTENDTFQEGQWLNGRIYERRCDLSPDGNLLVYFAAKHKEPHFSWTAISKPPYLKALAFWPKGDCWGGGGLFESDEMLLLNHRENEMTLAEGTALPSQFTIKAFGNRPGWGEDDPIYGTRLSRDGWRLVQEPTATEHKLGSPVWIEFDPPEVWSRVSRVHPHLELKMIVTGIHQKDGPWYVTEHELVNSNSNVVTSLGSTDWADWASNGDLLFAKDGTINRLRAEDGGLLPLKDAAVLIDLTERQFNAFEAPDDARSW